MQEKVGVEDISLTYSMNCEHSTKKGGLWKNSVYDHPSKIFVVQAKPVGYAGNDGNCVNLQKAGSSHIKSGRENVNMEISKEGHELSHTYVCMWVRFST